MLFLGDLHCISWKVEDIWDSLLIPLPSITNSTRDLIWMSTNASFNNTSRFSGKCVQLRKLVTWLWPTSLSCCPVSLVLWSLEKMLSLLWDSCLIWLIVPSLSTQLLWLRFTGKLLCCSWNLRSIDFWGDLNQGLKEIHFVLNQQMNSWKICRMFLPKLTYSTRVYRYSWQSQRYASLLLLLLCFIRGSFNQVSLKSQWLFLSWRFLHFKDGIHVICQPRFGLDHKSFIPDWTVFRLDFVERSRLNKSIESWLRLKGWEVYPNPCPSSKLTEKHILLHSFIIILIRVLLPFFSWLMQWVPCSPWFWWHTKRSSINFSWFRHFCSFVILCYALSSL